MSASMRTLPGFVSLIPMSGLQFLDVHFQLERLSRVARPFWEEPFPRGQEAASVALVSLRELQADDAGNLFDPLSGVSPLSDDIYNIGRVQALEPFLNRWVPLPFFRVAAIGPDGVETTEKGPTNWARIRMVELAEPDRDNNTHHAVLAFDTGLRPRDEKRPYTAISPADSARGSEFKMVSDRDAMAWFMNEEWMATWLADLLGDARASRRKPGRGAAEIPQGRACEHWARYICFVGMLAEARLLPRIKLVDVVSDNRAYEPINVELVLDIGNSRTCGILMEDDRDQRLNLNNSYALKLRDLGAPERCYAHPFESRVEFVRASFGNETLSRRSGRANAFQWQSPVRVGPEAVRRSAAALGNEGATGLSSPKRYLWDERPISQVWRFNGVASDGITNEPPVSGPFMMFLSEEGDVLRHARRGTPGARARFSRSSLATLLLTELLIQALSQMNAPETRYARSFPDVPRRLRRLLLTMPPAMALAEQRLFQQRAEAAVKLAWDMMGWGSPGANIPPEPRVVANLDEATATQLVFLYNEAAQRLRGDPGTFFDLAGRVRPGYGAAACLRVASIDVGGGTTDLMVCTYAAEHGQEIMPRQNFREGFRIAGDEVLQEVLQAIVVPQLEQALTAAGHRDAKAFLREILGGDRGSQSELERHLRRQIVAQILEPVGLAIIHAYEGVDGRDSGEILRTTFSLILAGRDISAPLSYFQSEAGHAGVRDFALADVAIVVAAGQVDAIVNATLGPILADLCEAVHAYDCDWLLLSGRPTRLRAVRDIILAKMPVPPHRIVGMHGYRVGGWYPFRDASARIDDPKTTAAVGAMLCALAEGRLEGMLLRSSQLTMRSTARFLGRMELSGQILRRNVLVQESDRALEAAGAAPPDLEFTMQFRAPIFLGFRQLDLERWPATRLYALEYRNPDSVPRLKLPLTLKLRRADIDPDKAGAEAKREAFTVTEILDADGDPLRPNEVQLRLQTEKSEAGYWRDTGALAIS